MKRLAIALAVLIVLGCAAWGFLAKPKSPAATGEAKSVSAVCPVMGNDIPDTSKAAGKSTYKDKTYYFCCSGCKPEFDKDPEKYVNDKK